MSAVRALAVVALIAVGCFFLTVGMVGLLRFPNVYNRMHATSKPTTLGIFFPFLTVPTGAHMTSRAAQRTGVPLPDTVTWPRRPDVENEGESETAGFDADEGERERNRSGERQRSGER
jgi:multicomponent Na+:H+ antiporter subunit G